METYYLQKLCVLTVCVLIDITVTINIAVGTGSNFPHHKVGTKSHHIKTYNTVHKLNQLYVCTLSSTRD